MRAAELGQFRSLLAVVERRSFARAAASLGLSPPALSQSIRALEERLGVQLFRRTTRSVTPTDVGLRLAERVGPVLAELDAAETEARGEEGAVRGTVRLNVPRVAAAHWVAGWLGPFAAAYPDVVLDVTVDDTLADIVAGRYDAGIRLGERLAGDMVAIPLQGKISLAVVATPAYFTTHGEPKVPRDLAAHRCINIRLSAKGMLYRWEFERQGRAMEVAVEGPLVVNDTALAVQAALDGAGIAYLFDFEAAPYLRAGRLRRVLSSWSPTFAGMHLYYPRHRYASPALRALVAMVRADLKGRRRAL